MENRRVLISGLGIGGPTLAFWLKRYGFSPTIVEIAPAPRRGGYMIDFWGVGYDVAERMRLIPHLREAGYKIDEVRLVNAKNRKVGRIAGDLFRSALGDNFLSILRGDLAYAIYREIEGGTPVLFGDEIVSLFEDENGVEARFRRNPPARFDLVIGADGLHSGVRRIVFGPDASFERPLGYWTASFTMRRYRHRNEGAYTSYSEPGRQIARYALRDGRTAFFFCWTDKGEPAPRHHDIAAERAALRKAFDGAGWEWPEIETGIDSADDLYLDSVSQVKAPAWSKGRVALLGDAACCPSLLAGQGAAFAMAGAYLLAGELAKSGGVYSAAYARYEEIFRPFVEKKQLGAVNFAEQFAPKTALSLWLRNLSTRLLAIPLIGQWLMHGMVGDDLPVPNYRQYERVMA